MGKMDSKLEMNSKTFFFFFKKGDNNSSKDLTKPFPLCPKLKKKGWQEFHFNPLKLKSVINTKSLGFT